MKKGKTLLVILAVILGISGFNVTASASYARLKVQLGCMTMQELTELQSPT